MAKLVPCKDCGHNVSKRAKSCPSCGVKRPGSRTSVGVWVVLGLVALVGYAVIFDNDSTTSSTSGARTPATSRERTVIDDAYSVCRALENTGLTTGCEVGVRTIDVRIDTSSAEAREMCAGIVDMMTQYTDRFEGDWQLRILSPFSGDQPVAVCTLR